MRKKQCALLVALSIVNLFGFNTLSAQNDCGDGAVYPRFGDTAESTGSPSGDIYANSFTITLQPVQDYTNWKVTEYDASPGTDTCATPYTNPAFIPPSPGVSGGVWYATGATWGPDNVGWLESSVNYIVQNPGVVPIPCTAQINQALDILCPGSNTPDLYNPSNPLDVYTLPNIFQNCRGGSGNQACGPNIAY